MKPRFFYSTPRMAATLGVSVRTIGRLSIDHEIKPMRFEGGGMRLRYFWTRLQIADFRRHLQKFSA